MSGWNPFLRPCVFVDLFRKRNEFALKYADP